MKRTPVTSSNLVSVGYDPATLTLEIEFNSGGVYQYVGVTPDKHQAFMNAKSKGTHFATNIKGKYNCTKL